MQVVRRMKMEEITVPLVAFFHASCIFPKAPLLTLKVAIVGELGPAEWSKD